METGNSEKGEDVPAMETVTSDEDVLCALEEDLSAMEEDLMETNRREAGMSAMKTESREASGPQHWFYQEVEGPWIPFSQVDSVAIESVYGGAEERVVKTHGTRFDVDIKLGTMEPVYWKGGSQPIRRCSWFHRAGVETAWEPYSEDVSSLLEVEYNLAAAAGEWRRRVCHTWSGGFGYDRVPLEGGEWVQLHSPNIIRHLKGVTPGGLAAAFGDWNWEEKEPLPSGDLWEVKRGVEGMDIPPGEDNELDHLVFVVHGIGSACDSKFRNIVEVVDLFREMAAQLLDKHFENVYGCKKINRVEFLPVNWHNQLHQEKGTDAAISPLTLPSLPMLRSFTNSTILDVLYYASPVHCQIIQDTTAEEINRLHSLFKERNPGFRGKISLIGHSLGSIILFDLLCGQRRSENKPPHTETSSTEGSQGCSSPTSSDGASSPKVASSDGATSPTVASSDGVTSPTVTVPLVNFPSLDIQPEHLFALGSPIAMFLSTRGVQKLGNDFTLPTCPKFYNIFHPYDPIAYRLEPLLDPSLASHSPALVPHHKGRKRLHKELTDLTKKVFTGIRAMIYMAGVTWNSAAATVEPVEDDSEPQNDPAKLDTLEARLNSGGRVDFALQETPFESINEYLFALSSHLSYWQSKDTCLFILKQMYGANGTYSP